MNEAEGIVLLVCVVYIWISFFLSFSLSLSLLSPLSLSPSLPPPPLSLLLLLSLYCASLISLFILNSSSSLIYLPPSKFRLSPSSTRLL